MADCLIGPYGSGRGDDAVLVANRRSGGAVIESLKLGLRVEERPAELRGHQALNGKARITTNDR